ncbi:MAG: DUF58 domain-containing protein [Acidimicrobiales bacterium]
MLSTRGAVLAGGAACSAIAGLVYGVEEFVFLAISVGVLLVVGAVSAWHRLRTTRRALHLVVNVPVAEVTARQTATVELTVTNVGRRRRPPVLVEDPRAHWSVSHPGLGETSIAGARRTGTASASGSRSPTASGRPPVGFTSLGQRSPAQGWLGAPGPRRTRRQRAQDRRRLSAARPVPDLGPGAGATLSVRVPTARRGLLTLSQVGVWCEDPFGLIALRITVAPPAHVIVYPAPAEPAHRGRPTGAHRGAQAPSATAGATDAMSGDELSGLRPYAPGDRLTRLHWPSMARSGELVVREFVEPRAGSLSLLVDLRPSAHSGDSIEKTISSAAGFGVGALDRGLTVELCTSTGDRVVITPNASGRQTMLRALALLGPATAPPAVVRRWGNRPTGGAVWATGSVQGADVVLVTTRSGAEQRTLPAALRGRAETVLVP